MRIMKTHKNMTNRELSELLRDVAGALQIKGKEGNRFRIIAYQRAADAVEHLSSEAKDLWDEKKLDEIPGVGTSIAKHLDEIFRTGKSRHFNAIERGIPPAVFKLMEVPGLGPKRAFKLAKKFNIGPAKPVERLKQLANEGKIEKLEGFGEDSQEEIFQNIKAYQKKPQKRLLLSYAEGISGELISWMKKSKEVIKVDPLGSLRRKASTIGDIDISVASNNPKEVIKHFTQYPKKVRMIEKGDRTASILIPGEIQVDLMVQDPGSYGALLQHFTGSKHHNIALREYALKKGLSLSEYGVKKLKVKGEKPKLAKFKDEESFYKYLGLELIPPELREDSGEIEVALKHKIPKLVDIADVKADLQIHSDFDIETSHDLGESSMEEVVKKASEFNYEYIAFSEHNPSKSGHSQKQIVEILKRKREKVDKLNYSLRKGGKNRIKKVFNSLEIDIMPDGSLPVGEEGLQTLDFALISIHSSFRMKRSEMTKRVISAFSHPKALIFAHPTARKLNFREGVELEWEKIFEFCLKNKKFLEINADPSRLDLPDFLVKEAVYKGVKLTLGTDSHHKDSLDNMRFGVYVARRGWATKNDIINTRSLTDFEKILRR
jgi:DNA polymerase (family 10)